MIEFKKKDIKKKITLFIFLLFVAIPISCAQKLALSHAEQQAVERHWLLKGSQLAIKKQKVLRKTATDLLPTQFTWQGGQYNSLYWDNSFAIAQSFSFPTIWAKQKEILSQEIQTLQFNYSINKNQLTKEVRLAYWEVAYWQAKIRLLNLQDSLLSNFVKAAQIRLKAGEGTLLEQTVAQSQQAELQHLLAQAQADRQIAQIALNTLLVREDTTLLLVEDLQEYEMVLPDTNSFFQNPTAQWLRHQIVLGQQNVSLEKAKLLPDLTLGYINQSLQGKYIVDGQERFLDNSSRFQSLQIGVAVPLWAKPQKARINASKIEVQINENELLMFKKQWNGALQQVLQQHKKVHHSLVFYTQTALPTALLVIKQAQTAYQAGEISYMAYLQAVQHHLKTQENYLQTLLTHQQNSVEIKFLMGE